jgi:predicted nucleic acid-binding protein
MHILDSSVWLEIFAGTSLGRKYLHLAENTDLLIVPAISLYEVFKKILHRRDEHLALQIIAQMKRGTVVNLDLELSLNAARLSQMHSLPMADSIILATAQKHKATLWTMDSDFSGIDGVKFISRR